MKKLFILVLTALLSFNLFYVFDVDVFADGRDALTEQSQIDPYALIEDLSGDAKNDFRLRSVSEVAYGTVYKFLQIHNGCEVYGNEIVVTVKNNGEVAVVGEYIDIPLLNENISLSQAEIIAEEKLGGEAVGAETKVFAYEHAPTLSYEIILDGKLKVFISAESGEILMSAPITNYALEKKQMQQTDAFGNNVTIDVIYNNILKNYQLADYVRNIYVVNAENKTDVSNAKDYITSNGQFEPIAVSAYMNVIKAYDFYTDADNIGVSLKGINGANDDKMNSDSDSEEIPIFIFMHYGENYENAACAYLPDQNTVVMYVGDGNENGMMYQPGKALDILAHEYQHAVTAVKAELEYVNDSGALNEAFSDIFGALVEGRDPSDPKFWTIGEDTAVAPNTEIRSMIGGTTGQKYSMSDKASCKFPWHNRRGHDEMCDYGGVHYNSTIVTHMQYELYKKMPEFFTRQNIGLLWYNTLCSLTANATFEEFAACFLQTAINLEFPEEVCATIKATLIEEEFMEEETIYTVTFLDESDNILSQLSVVEGQSVPVDKCPVPPQKPMDERYSYEFEGWELPEVVTQDITLKAKYKEITRLYEICLVNMDGKILEYINYAYGDEIKTSDFPMPKAPGKDYVFDDWYVGKDSTAKADGTIVQTDLILYARWIKEEKTASCGAVGYYGGGGSGIMCGAILLLCIPVLFLRRKSRA